MQDVPLTINFNGKQLKGFAVPLEESPLKIPEAFDIIIDKAFLGTLRWNANEWKIDSEQDPQLVEQIGSNIRKWYN